MPAGQIHPAVSGVSGLAHGGHTQDLGHGIAWITGRDIACQQAKYTAPSSTSGLTNGGHTSGFEAWNSMKCSPSLRH